MYAHRAPRRALLHRTGPDEQDRQALRMGAGCGVGPAGHRVTTLSPTLTARTSGVEEVIMSPPTASPSLPAVPLDVLDFATEQGVVLYLRPLLTMTRGIFPDESIRLRLEEDPEIANLR